MVRSSREAQTRRENTSRPIWSVPAQLVADGGDSAGPAPEASGSKGAIQGAKIAMQASSAAPTSAISVTGFCRSTQTAEPRREGARGALCRLMTGSPAGR